MLAGIFRGIDYFLTIVSYAIFIYCILSWLVSPFNKAMRFFARIVDPLLRPIRNVMFRIFPHMRMDLSALVAYVLLELLRNGIWRLYYQLLR